MDKLKAGLALARRRKEQKEAEQQAGAFLSGFEGAIDVILKDLVSELDSVSLKIQAIQERSDASDGVKNELQQTMDTLGRIAGIVHAQSVAAEKILMERFENPPPVPPFRDEEFEADSPAPPLPPRENEIEANKDTFTRQVTTMFAAELEQARMALRKAPERPPTKSSLRQVLTQAVKQRRLAVADNEDSEDSEDSEEDDNWITERQINSWVDGVRYHIGSCAQCRYPAPYLCGACSSVRYCSAECMKTHGHACKQSRWDYK